MVPILFLFLNFTISGGESVIVQIDETKVGAKRKYNRGRLNPGLDMWVFGMICQQTKRAFVRLVEDRTRATLLLIIQDGIFRGTTIYIYIE